MCPQHTYSHALGAEITKLENLRAILANAVSSLGAHRRNIDVNAADLMSSAQKFHELANALTHQPQYDLDSIPANQDLLDGLSALFHIRSEHELARQNKREALIERLIENNPELREAFNRIRSRRRSGSSQNSKHHFNRADEKGFLDSNPLKNHNRINNLNKDLIEKFEDLAKYMIKVLDNNLLTKRGEKSSPTAAKDEQDYLMKLQALKKRVQQYFLESDFAYQQIIEDVLGTSVYELAILEFGCSMWGLRQQVPVNVTELAQELGINPGEIDTPSHHVSASYKALKPKPSGADGS